MEPIPRFPTFRLLEITDRLVIEAITRRFPPYSDYGFTSLWSWNTDETCAISLLGENLVVRFRDYTTDDHFLSFLGQDAVIETVRTLLDFARREGLPAELRLIPDVAIVAADRLHTLFAVTPDLANDDYVYRSDHWACISASGSRRHRRQLTRGQETATFDVRPIDPKDPACREAIVGIYDRWAEQTSLSPGGDRDHERVALQRALDLVDRERLAACGLFDRERLAGFSIWEVLAGGEWIAVHFQKADRTYQGLSTLQVRELGRICRDRGISLINAQQDLGIAGLRDFKRSLGPCCMLQKYVIADRG
jgi:hypothetical protein